VCSLFVLLAPAGPWARNTFQVTATVAWGSGGRVDTCVEDSGGKCIRGTKFLGGGLISVELT